MGRTELQAPSTEVADRSSAADEVPSSPVSTSSAVSTSSMLPLPAPAPDALVAVRPDGTPVSAGEIKLSVGKVPVPPGATLVSSESVNEVQSFAEELQRMSVDEIAKDAIAVEGVDRTYSSDLAYGDVVTFFDESLAKGGFTTTRREATSDVTAWGVRCPGGEIAHVAVRKTSPTTVEIVEARRPAAASDETPRSTMATPAP